MVETKPMTVTKIPWLDFDIFPKSPLPTSFGAEQVGLPTAPLFSAEFWRGEFTSSNFYKRESNLKL